jgi:hypothetical protein
MTKLTAATRNALPAFALPGRKYPIHDRTHAIDAKARATQQWEAGNLSHGDFLAVQRAANRKLGRSR